MSTSDLGSPRSDHSDNDVIAVERRRIDAVGEDVGGQVVDVSSVSAQADRDQLERDFADIERAAAALRRAEPALESWTQPMAAPVRKPRPLWLLIGLLWLSTALVTAGAVVTIARLAG
jgi:hypothetical protein